jgi:hypothetical protein
MIPFEIGDIAGYVASALMLSTFGTRTMIPLRILGICSSIAFLAYGYLEDLVPILVLHCLMLPTNVWRLVQILRLSRRIHETAQGDLPIDRLLPLMSKREVKAGEVLFRKGDLADEAYYLLDGSVRFEEIGSEVGSGALFGEIGVFSPHNERMATAVCQTDGRVLVITANDMMRLYFQSPAIGYHVLQLVIRRMIENVSRIGRPAGA